MAEVSWSVTAGANAVTFTPHPPTEEPLPQWAFQVRGRLPSNEEVIPVVEGNTLYFSPPLPRDSAIVALEQVLHVVT